MKTLVVAAVCVLAVMATQSYASCFIGMIHEEDGKKFCNGLKGKLNVGEKARHDCMDCECTAGGLSCCGVGYNAGTMSVQGCTMKKLDDCCYEFVKTDDATQICMEKSCPNPLHIEDIPLVTELP